MRKLSLLKTMLLLCALVAGSASVWAAPGDEIKSPSNVVSGKWYYIKGVYTSSSVEYSQYYAPSTDAKDTKVTNAAATDIANAMPILFTQVTGGWTLQTPNGYYVRPHSSNGQSYLLEDEFVMTLTSGDTKEGTGKGIKIGKYTASSKDWYLQANQQSAKIGGYKDTQWDVTLIEAGEVTINSACTDGSQFFGTYSSSVAFVVPSVLTVSEVKVVSGKLQLSNYDTGDIVPANTGVLVSSATAKKFVLAPTTGGTSLLGSGNMLKGSGDDGITASAMTAANTLFYRLTIHNGSTIGFWWGAADGAAFDLAANKAYLAVPVDAAREGFGFDDTTGIENVNRETITITVITRWMAARWRTRRKASTS